MGSMSAANQMKASLFAGELGEALLARPDVEHVETQVIDLGMQVGVLVRRGGRDLVFRVVLPSRMHADGYCEVTL